jgi:hypothetical protein
MIHFGKNLSLVSRRLGGHEEIKLTEKIKMESYLATLNDSNGMITLDEIGNKI